jgi:hypothetical protein
MSASWNSNPFAALVSGCLPPVTPMAELIFRCPYSNRPIASGINIERRDAQKIRDYPIRIRCPHCGFDHDGTIADAELREAA